MTPKEKAQELFDKYSKGKDEHGWHLCEFDSCAKLCALIAVDEILKNQENVVWKINKLLSAFSIDKKLELSKKYWQEVKQFIEEI
jgi:hypothetical protein